MALQIKRNLSFEGSMQEAINGILNMSPKLVAGEPLLCRCVENGVLKYFLCIGIGEGRVRSFPLMDAEEILEFIQQNAQKFNLIDSISEYSDIAALEGDDGKVILKLKDTINK